MYIIEDLKTAVRLRSRPKFPRIHHFFLHFLQKIYKLNALRKSSERSLKLAKAHLAKYKRKNKIDRNQKNNF
jgi:hypothetical protein